MRWSLLADFYELHRLAQDSGVKKKSPVFSLLACFLLILTFQVGSASALELYVAPDGSDSADGRIDRPLRTLDGARLAVRRLGVRDSENVSVFFRAGRYPFKKAVVFESGDSGLGEGRVIYRAFKGESVVFDGCEPVRGWSVFDRERGIYRASIDSEGIRQLYVSGKPAVRSRYPNSQAGEPFGPFLPLRVLSASEVVIAEKDLKSSGLTGAEKGVELVVVSHWYQQYLRYSAWRTMGNDVLLTLTGPAQRMNKQLQFYAGSVFRFENALELVDQANEWFFDESSRYVYYKPNPGVVPDDSLAMFPVASSLVDIVGKAGAPVRNVEFSGIIFQCSNWNYPSRRGINLTQFSQPVGLEGGKSGEGYPTGMVRVSQASQVAFRNSVFRFAGASAIQFVENVDDADLEGNRIYDIAGNGIEIDSHALRNPSPEKQSEGVAVWNNEIFRVGQSYTNGGALLANNVRGLIVEHNWIHDLPYSGIQICNQPGGPGRDVGCAANRVRFNRVNDCMLLHDDGGGIYSLGGVQRGSVIADNYLFNIGKSRWAGSYPIDLIYLDNFTSSVLVVGNVVRGGRAAERNGASGNYLVGNLQQDEGLERKAGVNPGFKPVR